MAQGSRTSGRIALFGRLVLGMGLATGPAGCFSAAKPRDPGKPLPLPSALPAPTPSPKPAPKPLGTVPQPAVSAPSPTVAAPIINPSLALANDPLQRGPSPTPPLAAPTLPGISHAPPTPGAGTSSRSSASTMVLPPITTPAPATPVSLATAPGNNLRNLVPPERPAAESAAAPPGLMAVPESPPSSSQLPAAPPLPSLGKPEVAPGAAGLVMPTLGN